MEQVYYHYIAIVVLLFMSYHFYCEVKTYRIMADEIRELKTMKPNNEKEKEKTVRVCNPDLD